MQRVLLASLVALTVSACAYRPDITDPILIMDDATDVRSCTRLAQVSPVVATTGTFDAALESMLVQTVALGGTHLYLDQESRDWLLVRGIAYRCGGAPAGRAVIVRAKG